MVSVSDPQIQLILRKTLNGRIAQLLYARFLVDMEDGRKVADVIADMILKEKGRGNSAGYLISSRREDE